jgi:hypothetical protein
MPVEQGSAVEGLVKGTKIVPAYINYPVDICGLLGCKFPRTFLLFLTNQNCD